MLIHPGRLVVAAAAALPLALVPGARASAQQADDFRGREQLRAHTREFRKEIVQVAQGVHVAVGYSAANVTLISGADGSIIVDTGSDTVEARAIRDAFGPLLRTPVRAIIYTHGHPDHTGGARVFAAGATPEIVSHALLTDAPPELVRTARDGGDQFGMTLPESLFINAGVQRQFGREVPPSRAGYLAPTRTFGGRTLTLAVAGVTLQLLHTPGEARENVAVWLPSQRVVLAGDNIYRAFPNLSPVRGIRLRAPEPWIESLDSLRALGAAALVPGHTRPVRGADSVRAVLTAYRDGMQSVLDQTLTGIRAGARPDELVASVTLPPALAGHPFLQEYYGSIAWTVRGIYADRLGWLDGNATNLFPLSARERGERMAKQLGGTDRIVALARDALVARDWQWAAELADHVLAADSTHAGARRAKAEALTALAERQVNATARNYYLSAAQALMKDLPR